MSATHSQTLPTCKLTLNTGLNELKGFNILAAQALVTPDPDGSNFRGVANLPNPSIVSFELVSMPALHDDSC